METITDTVIIVAMVAGIGYFWYRNPRALRERVTADSQYSVNQDDLSNRAPHDAIKHPSGIYNQPGKAIGTYIPNKKHPWGYDYYIPPKGQTRLV